MAETNTLILEATILSGESLSSAIDMSAFALNKDNFRVFGVLMPSSWTSANFTFQGSIDDGISWHDIYDSEGNEFVSSADASRIILFSPIALSCIVLMRIRSGTSSAPVVQTSERKLNIISRNI